MTFLQKKYIGIFDGDTTICNVTLHFYFVFFFLHLYESAFSELLKTFLPLTKWDMISSDFAFCLCMFLTILLIIQALKKSAFTAFVSHYFRLCGVNKHLVDVYFFSQLKYWQFRVVDAFASDSVVFVQCAA